MSRRHFEALARELLYARPEAPVNAAALVQWHRTVKAVADVCASFNGNFDRGRFYRVAGADL